MVAMSTDLMMILQGLGENLKCNENISCGH